MKNRTSITILALALIGALLFSLLTVYASAEGTRALKKKIDVSARSAALYVPATREFLFSKNADERRPMASTTKIMTALVALEHADISDTVTIDERAVGIEGSSAYLKAGEQLCLEELIYALMLQSANDAAAAIAYHVAVDIESFADMMNMRASDMGLRDTSFKNPHGLDDAEHYTTAHDLAVIAASALDNPFLRKVSSTYKKTFRSDERQRTYVNHNKLLRRFDGAIGLKTGFTKKSGRCLVGAAERDGLTLVSVTLDAPNDWSDHSAMLEGGYSLIERVNLLSDGELCYDVPVINGESTSVRVTCESGFSLVLPRAEREIKRYVKLSRLAVAPIRKGDVMGTVIFTIDGEKVGSVNLIATEDVPLKKKSNLFYRIFKKD